MSKFEEFKARWPGRLDKVTEEEIRLFFESVVDLSDDYDHWCARLRATGKFKSLFDSGANTRRTTNMTTTPVLSDKERREYPLHLYKTILGMAQDRKKPSGLAAAISDFLGHENRHFEVQNDTTLLVPLEALISRKALEATSAPAGGFLIANDIGRQIEFMLRASSVCIRAGARVLPGLRGDLTLGRETQEVTCEWLHELEEVDETDSQYGAVRLTPHRLSGFTSLSTQLQAQAASPDIVSGFVVDSLSRGIGTAFDRAAIRGSGVLGEPLGLFNRESVKTVTFSGAATWTKAVNFEAQISGANADDDSITFIANPDVREKWYTIPRVSGSGGTLWEGSQDLWPRCRAGDFGRRFEVRIFTGARFFIPSLFCSGAL